MSRNKIHEDAKISNVLPKKLVRTNWQENRRFIDELSPLNLTIPQFFTLDSLASLGGKSTVGQLAQATYQAPASMTGIIDRLLRDGLVERGRDDGDRRTVWVAITPAGCKLLEMAWTKTLGSLDPILSTMDDEELETVSRFIDALSTAMEN